MISSLANFLMLVFYHGGQPFKLAWTLVFFTLGTVGIARVSIEKDRSTAMGYAGLLGIVAFIAMLRYVNSPIFSGFILILIAVLADRIVHDCTLIDESVDSSGQGLIDSGRMFVKKKIESDEIAEDDAQPVRTKAGKGQNQPGRTVLYLALAALPLFGIGQFLLRDDQHTWQRAQFLLAFYLFSSLSLLVTTSFLGLRRYLRQRHVDMPKDVSIAWLAGGLILIGAILTIGYLAPLPGRAIASFKVPEFEFLDSPSDTEASRFGWGEDAADKGAPGASTTANDPNQQGKEIQSIRTQRGAEAGNAADGDREDGPAGQQKGGEKSGGGDQQSKDNGKGESESQQQGSQSQHNQSQESSQANGEDGGEGESGQQGESSQSADNAQESGDESNSPESPKQGDDVEAAEKQDASPTPLDQENNPDENDADGAESQQQQESQSQSADAKQTSLPSEFPEALGGFFKALIFLLLIGIVGAYLWINRDAIAEFFRNLLSWGQREPESKQGTLRDLIETDSRAPPKPFASYRNPFGLEKDPRRIVVITFQAFEAWSREQGATRGKDETPSEFIQRISKSVPTVSAPAAKVVDSYNRIVYGRGKASQNDLDAAQQVWTAMRA